VTQDAVSYIRRGEKRQRGAAEDAVRKAPLAPGLRPGEGLIDLVAKRPGDHRRSRQPHVTCWRGDLRLGLKADGRQYPMSIGKIPADIHPNLAYILLRSDCSAVFQLPIQPPAGWAYHPAGRFRLQVLPINYVGSCSSSCHFLASSSQESELGSQCRVSRHGDQFDDARQLSLPALRRPRVIFPSRSACRSFYPSCLFQAPPEGLHGAG
jgi:hypothetical protein